MFLADDTGKSWVSKTGHRAGGKFGYCIVCLDFAAMPNTFIEQKNLLNDLSTVPISLQ
jgi:hypothetical protein